MDFTKICTEYGIIGVVLLGVGTGFFFILKWVLEQFKVELIGNREERKQYLETLGKLSAQVEEHSCRSREFHVANASEHKEMISALGRINGYKKE